MEQMKATDTRKTEELREEDLAPVSGGATQNRYDANKCSKNKAVAYDCVGLLSAVWCDHYRRDFQREEGYMTVHWHRCMMGCFDYEEEKEKRDIPGQGY